MRRCVQHRPSDQLDLMRDFVRAQVMAVLRLRALAKSPVGTTVSPILAWTC